MKNIFSIVAAFVFLPHTHMLAQNTTVAKTSVAPFRGTKKFCAYTHSSIYTITVHGNNAKIVYTYNEDSTILQGTFKNGDLYTNDPDEKANKKFAGKYYKLTAKGFRILNTENGDYDEYHVCDY